jgi:hypothetical protein
MNLKGSVHSLTEVFFWHLLKGIKNMNLSWTWPKNMKAFSQYSRYPDQDINWATTESESTELPLGQYVQW